MRGAGRYGIGFPLLALARYQRLVEGRAHSGAFVGYTTS